METDGRRTEDLEGSETTLCDATCPTHTAKMNPDVDWGLWALLMVQEFPQLH